MVIRVMVASLALGAAAQELPLRDTAQGKLFGTERFAVRLDAQTGWAGEVLCDGQTVVKASESRQLFDLRQDEKWVTGGGAAIEGLGVERVAPDTVKGRLRAGEWRVDAYVQVDPERRMLRRWFEIAWQGASDTKIKGFWFQAGLLPLAQGGSYFYPMQYPPRRVSAKELVPERRTHGGHSPFPLIGETGGGWSAVWLSDELPDYADGGGVGAVEGAGQIRVTQSFNLLGHVRKGVPQRVGDAWLWLQPNDSETALRRLSEWFRLVKQVPPEGRPDWLSRMILYSFHPGGTIGSGCKDLGGFRPATELLPHIRDLGCNAIWLMPLEDKSIYCPRDYYKLQEGLGSPDDYKALTKRAHALGLRVWQDCVPHGGCNDFLRAKEHPEWLAQNEDGSTLSYWCFDFNWPTWIDYMSHVVSFYTREYGLDGLRIDAVGGSHIPNWNPAIPYARASLSQSQGGLAMQRALRRAVREVCPDGANLAEVGSSVHGATSDAIYDFDLCYSVLHDFRRQPAEEFASRLRRWLHEQACAQVPDLVRLRHVESHDSLRSGLWYGADAQRALVALTTWIHGIPLVYHEMEDGSFEAYRQIFRVRRDVAELNGGASDYLSVSAPDGVFACLRTGVRPVSGGAAWHEDYAWDTRPRGADRASVVLVNLKGVPVSGCVSVPAQSLPAGLRTAAWARDLMSGEEVAVAGGAMQVSLAPFGYTVLRFGSRALPELAAAAARPPAGRAAVAADGALALKSKAGVLEIDPATGLASAWRSGRRTLAAGMDLALPEDLARLAPHVVCREADGAVEVTRKMGPHTLTLRYAKADDGIAVRASWVGGVPPGAALVFDVPAAETWLAGTSEGLFESPFRVRHPGFDGSLGSIYRLPQGTAVVWDSRQHPFGLSEASAWVGAAVAGDVPRFVFDPVRLPASVQVLDRVGSVHGMKVLMAWRTEEPGVAVGGEELQFSLRLADGPAARQSAGTGDARLSLAGGGWVFENAHYRARVSREGALTELWRRSDGTWRKLAGPGGLYTDRGFGPDGERYAQENDVEAFARLERVADGVRLVFGGELRGFQRFDKMGRPIRFYSAYAFGDAPSFRQTLGFKPSVGPTGGSAYLAYLLRVDDGRRVTFADAAGEILSGVRGDDRSRFAQTLLGPQPQRLPGTIRVDGTNGAQVCLGDVQWFGARPANLFMHGGELHVAWLDGKAGEREAGAWRGVSLSVSCGAAEAAPQEAGPVVAKDACGGLIRDGGFGQNGAAPLRLVRAGLALAQPEQARSATWLMPNGAEFAVDGGNRCVTVVGDGREYRLVRQALPQALLPARSTWRLSARMRGEHVEKGDAGWKTACLRWSVTAKGRTQFTTVSLPLGDSPWRDYAVQVELPEDVSEVEVEAGLNGNRGQVWVDDVAVERVDR